MGLMDGKKGVVLGVANKRSIAWAITKALHAEGAQVALTYESERLKERVEKLAPEVGEPPLIQCDVTDDAQIDALFGRLEEEFGRLDFLVHSIAYAPREALEGSFVETSREAFRIAHDVSAYSLIALAARARHLMTGGGSIIAMTYHGSRQVSPNYNVMGVAKASLEASVRYLAWDLGPKNIRVNAISAGPLNTLAARGIAGFTDYLKEAAERAPLKRNISVEEVANTAVFLLSDKSSGITGDTVYVDAGQNIMGI